MSNVKSRLVSSLAAVSIALLPMAAFAEGTVTPVDTLKTETGKLTTVYDSVIPVAVGSLVFSIGAVLVKRIAFS